MMVWLILLDYASQNDKCRGSVKGLKDEEIAMVAEIPLKTVSTILEALRKRGTLMPDGTLTSWEERQSCDKSTARVQKHRAMKRNETNETVSVFHETGETQIDREIERNKEQTAPSSPSGLVTNYGEYPKTAAAVHKIDPAANGMFLMRLVNTTAQYILSDPTFPPDLAERAVSDEWIAKAVNESISKWSSRKPHGAGLLLSRVPQILKTWSND